MVVGVGKGADPGIALEEAKGSDVQPEGSSDVTGRIVRVLSRLERGAGRVSVAEKAA